MRTGSFLERVAGPWTEAVWWGLGCGGQLPWKCWLAKEGSMAQQRFIEVPVDTKGGEATGSVIMLEGAWGSPGTRGGCVAGSEDRPSG